MKQILQRYKHAGWLFFYACIYIPWFLFLEKTVVTRYHLIHMNLDDYIPFNEIFVIPYFLWFVYIISTVIYFLFTEKSDYYRLCTFLFTGMTIFLIISTIFPNGHHLRPVEFPRDNYLTSLVAGLYKKDTSTNIFPSIHVFNSLGAHIAIIRSERFQSKKWIRHGSLVLCISIILSTCFLKQHSVFDVITAFIMALILYILVYLVDYSALMERRRKKVESEHFI